MASRNSEQQYKITFHLDNEVGKAMQPIHLDGLLCWSRVQEDVNTWENQYDIPLARYETQNGWVFKASEIEVHSRGKNMFVSTKRIVLEELASFDNMDVTKKMPKRIETHKGVWKAGIINRHTQLARVATAYFVCDPGELPRVKQLLNRIKSIGPLGKLGYGRVNGYTIEEVSNQPEMWIYRNMPDAYTADFKPLEGRLRAPYWLRVERDIVYRSAAANHSIFG